MTLLSVSCSKTEEAPHQFSSYDYRMDGSRHVPDVGVPSIVTSMEISSIIPSWAKGKDSMYYDFFLTAPVPLYRGGEYFYLLADGMTQTSMVIAANEKTSKIFASIPNAGTIVNILTDKSGAYTIHSNGNIEAFDTNGKLRWQRKEDAFGVNAILADSELIVSGANTSWDHLHPRPILVAYNIYAGTSPWRIDSMFTLQSLIYDSERHQIVAAGDSAIICFGLDRKVKSYTPLDQRIISNLCLCGKNKDLIAFGYLAKKPGSDDRTMNVGIFTANSKNERLQKVSSHEVAYLPVNISSNGSVVLSSGFYDSGTELTSGIDAFYADDTVKLWQRRFTYPLAASVAISDKYAYFTLTFPTEATVPAQSIFYTLDLSTGKTLGELPITGAHNGFAPGIPVPMGESGFILADRNKPTLYFLKP